MNAPTPGWNPDPTGRHEYRYWDGGSWTDDVSDNGVTAVDPIASPVGGPAPFGQDATGTVDPTQQYATAPGAQPPGFGPQPGAQPTGFGQPPGYGPQPGFDPVYGNSGQVPPGQPVKSGPSTGLIVGLVAAAVILIVGLVVVLGGGDDDDTATDQTTTTADTTEDTTPDTTADTTPETTEATGPEDADVFTLQVGDCLVDQTADAEVEEVPVVPCDQPHAQEIYYSHIIDADALPDETEMQTIVGDACIVQFETFVGLPYDDSVLDVTWLEPTQGSWDSGDRELLCMVIDPSTDSVTGTLAGANR